MGIQAIALLKLEDCSPSPDSGMRAERITDAVLLHTGASFASEPEELLALVHAALGPALSEHADPRGLFFLPDVAAPKARSYDAIVDEVGEGGVWAPLEATLADAFALPDGMGALTAVLGSMLQHMPESVMQAAGAAARGDMAAFNAVGDHVAAMLQPNGSGPGFDLAQLLGGAGAAPGLQEMLAGLEAELARDPQKLQRLAEQFFGGGALEPDDGDDPSEKR